MWRDNDRCAAREVWAAPVGFFFIACAKPHVLSCENNNARLNRALCNEINDSSSHFDVDFKVLAAVPPRSSLPTNVDLNVFTAAPN